MCRSALMVAATLAVAGICAAPASAQWVLLEDFEDVALNANLGDANPGESFTLIIQSGQSPTATVVASPWDAQNQAARVANPGAALVMPLGAQSILQGTTGTLFYQIYRTGLVNMSSGLTDMASFSDYNFGHFESQLNVNANAEPQAIRMRSAGAFLAGGRDFVINELFNVWHVVNNTTDTTQTYIQQVGVDAAPVQLFNGTTTDFVFRNSGGGPFANDLVQFLFMTGAANATDAGHTTVFLDNIYVDTSGANVINPIPEPASLALVGIGAAFLVGRRRR